MVGSGFVWSVVFNAVLHVGTAFFVEAGLCRDRLFGHGDRTISDRVYGSALFFAQYGFLRDRLGHLRHSGLFVSASQRRHFVVDGRGFGNRSHCLSV